MTPTDAQAAVIKQIVAWYLGGNDTPQVFYLAGFAGVGKTTLARIAIDELRAMTAHYLIVATATFTGKAAHVLRKKGVDNARTIHSLIYMPVEDPETGKVTFRLSADAPASLADLILLDEVSMVNEAMAKDIRSFGKKMLVMGDPGQLPPVSGMGAFFTADPDAFLTEVHRQAAESPILRLATLAREGKPLPLGQWTDAAGNVSRVLEHGAVTQAELYRPETQPICGIHRVRWGYTQRIRTRRGFEGPRPLVGEPVLCVRNDRDLGIFNGGFGTITEAPRDLADGIHWRMSIEMEDLSAPLKAIPVHPYPFQQHFDQATRKPDRVGKGIQEFDFGYLLTCHKAQGSEWPDVTIVDDGGAFRGDQHKWRYTALTRASESVTFLKRAA